MWSPDPYAQQTLGYGAQQMDPVYGASVVPWSAPLAEGAANPLVSPTHVASAAPVHVATAAARGHLNPVCCTGDVDGSRGAGLFEFDNPLENSSEPP